MTLIFTPGLPLESYRVESKKYTVIRYEGLTVYDHEGRQDYYFYGEDWSLRKQLFMQQFAHLSPVQKADVSTVRVSKTGWKKTKGGTLKNVGA